MRKNTSAESGAFNPRIFLAFLLCSLGASLALVSFASTPPSGTLSEATPVLTYDAGPFFQPNQSPLGLGQLDSGPRCNGQFPCDNYALTVSLPAGYAAAHPNASLKVTMYWTDTGSGQSDYDFYMYKGVVGNLSGSQQADYQAASGANPEVASVTPLLDGQTQYSLKIVPYLPTGETVHVRIELLAGSGSAGGFPGFGGPDPTAPGVPRYQNFYAPSGTSAEPSNGEFNIGFNPATGRIMTMNSGPVWRLTPPERLSPPLPEAGEALWQDKSAATTNIGVDPILWTDQKTGRTFASNSTVGTNGVYAFSDNDGDFWNPLSAAPPNASSDHQTIGSGPYPAALSGLTTGLNKGEAVYYCAQTFPVGAAACQRSDTLGSSYGPSTFPYNGNNAGDICDGIHGHVKVGPDGTVYLPVRDCSGNAGVSISGDGGVTWTQHVIPNSKTQTHGSDPSIAIGANNTVYFFYVADQTSNPLNPSEGHIRVQVSTDHGATWTKDTDLGLSHGIKNAVFPEAVAGDDNRASVGFLGTDKAGDYEGASFAGIWYLFIATTYDSGNTWNVVNATPNDPVQGVGGIWLGGGSNQNRNLLDFNEVTMDDKGRVLFGYSDGCVTAPCIAGAANTDYVAFMRVARQSGGKSLLAAFDTAEPVAPKPPYLSGTRDAEASHLNWKAPDNGGSTITKYQILRGTARGAEAVIAESVSNKFDDTSANPAVAHYYYTVRAINAAGTGLQSNEVDLTVAPQPPPENVCAPPGLTKLTDPAGDSLLTPSAGTDLLSAHISQPYAPDGNIKLAFTINTDPGQALQPANSSWYVAMKLVNGATTTYKAVRMTWNGVTPIFESYTPGASTGGNVDGRFVTAGTQKPAEPESNYVAPYDKVVIVVKASDLGLAPGATISGFVSGVAQSVVLGAALYDQMPDSLSYTGSYTVNSNQVCSPNNAPTAVLTATPTLGTAPLAVKFNGSGSYDPDSDTIASYTFSFGDGSPAVTQSAPTTSHSYSASGSYPAQLTVKDSRGEVSTNTSRVVITVRGKPPKK